MSELPKGWVSCSFEEINSSESKNIVPSQFETERFELYSVPTFPTGKPEFLDGQEIGSMKQIVEPGDVLVCKINPRINRVWQVMAKGEYRQIASSEWIVMRSRQLEPRYLRYYFASSDFRELICDGVTGVGGSLTRAQPKRVAMFPIPLAPLAEQKRIADKLDALLARVDRARTRLDRVPLILKRFRQAVLSAATSGQLTEDWRGESNDELASINFVDADCFGDYRFPESWVVTRLGEVANVMGGITKDAKKQEQADEELPYLRVANVQRGFLDLTEIKTIRVPQRRLDDLLLKKGDILFNEGGDIDKLGRGWIWSGEIERCTFQNHVFRARLHDKRFAPKFFSWYGNSRGYDYFLSNGKQTTNLASINRTLVSALPIVVPPPDEQHEIVRRVETLFAFADRLQARYQAARSQVDQLTPALLAQAFRGELVPQDPNDEPAALLLERIRNHLGK